MRRIITETACILRPKSRVDVTGTWPAGIRNFATAPVNYAVITGSCVPSVYLGVQLIFIQKCRPTWGDIVLRRYLAPFPDRQLSTFGRAQACYIFLVGKQWYLLQVVH